MRVSVRIVFADLANACFSTSLRSLQECLLNLEHLLLDAAWRVNVEHAGLSHEEELLVMGLRSR